jgi:hypothetical protein
MKRTREGGVPHVRFGSRVVRTTRRHFRSSLHSRRALFIPRGAREAHVCLTGPTCPNRPGPSVPWTSTGNQMIDADTSVSGRAGSFGFSWPPEQSATSSRKLASYRILRLPNECCETDFCTFIGIRATESGAYDPSCHWSPNGGLSVFLMSHFTLQLAVRTTIRANEIKERVAAVQLAVVQH